MADLFRLPSTTRGFIRLPSLAILAAGALLLARDNKTGHVGVDTDDGLRPVRHAGPPVDLDDDGAQSPKARRFAMLRKASVGAPQTDEPLGGPLSAEEEKVANRTIPGDSIPLTATEEAQKAAGAIWSFNDGDEERSSSWQSIGPTNAVYPAVLNRTPTDYVASGRITALAVSPRCDADRCAIYVGAAGGGIWKTTHGLSDAPTWQFISGSFASNAIGSITIAASRTQDAEGEDAETLFVGTGEPNISQDSGAGMGIYRSTNGGENWTLLPAVATVGAATYGNFPKGRAIGAIAIDPRTSRTIYVALNRGVRGITSVTGGGSGSPPPGTAAPIGLYKSTDGGATFSFIWDGAGTVRGVNAVALDPRDPDTVYAAAIQSGIYRSSPSDGAGAFQQVFEGQSQLVDPDRTEFALAAMPNGRTRIYASDGAVGPFVGYSAPFASESQVWRTDNANESAAQMLAEQKAAESGAPVAGSWKKLTSRINGTPGYATYNFCTGQCWYDNAIFSPAGSPDTVFVLGSYQYGERGGRSNARAVLRSTTAGDAAPITGVTFTDMTIDGSSDIAPNGIHPDQHALAFVPGNPNIWFEGSDGGLVRSSGNYKDISYQCASRPIGLASMATCKRVLSAVPTLVTSLNFGLDTLQFQSFSVNPQNALGELLGGTQDNGTFHFNGSKVTWGQSFFGDGGQSGFNAATPSTQYATNYGPSVSVNFHAGDPNDWVWASDPLYASGEATAFYIPLVADPVPASAGTLFAGLRHIWRTTDNGGDQAYLEANCGEVSLPSTPLSCGDWEPLGIALGPASDYVVAIARTPSDRNTLWAATRTGKVGISTNANAAAASVVFHRLDLLSPNAPPRFVSGIVIDPVNPRHAWISYTGYSATIASPGAPPNKPGHVFEVNWDGVGAPTWTAIDGGVGPIGDLPINGLARDDRTGDLFAATDFGVVQRVAGTTHWHAAAPGMPTVEVAGLTLNTGNRVLYAATHGRGGYRLTLRSNSEESAER